MTKTRKNRSRFKPPHQARNRAIVAATAIGAIASAVGAALHFGLFDRFRGKEGNAGAEHAAPDLAADRAAPGPHDRAPDAFRPDPTAAVPASEREGLRPATGSSPSLVEDRGAMRSQTAPANG